MTRSEVLHHLYATFNTHPLYDINLVKLNNILDEVAAHEREACAKVCDEIGGAESADCADAIRARGEV